ncbi:MAG: hypothetical protein AAB776_02105 [Patescibacteria group bacterium]
MRDAARRASHIEDTLAGQVDRKRGHRPNSDVDSSSTRSSKLVFRNGQYVDAAAVVTGTPKPAPARIAQPAATRPKVVTIVLEQPITKTEPEPIPAPVIAIVNEPTPTPVVVPALPAKSVPVPEPIKLEPSPWRTPADSAKLKELAQAFSSQKPSRPPVVELPTRPKRKQMSRADKKKQKFRSSSHHRKEELLGRIEKLHPSAIENTETSYRLNVSGIKSPYVPTGAEAFRSQYQMYALDRAIKNAGDFSRLTAIERYMDLLEATSRRIDKLGLDAVKAERKAQTSCKLEVVTPWSARDKRDLSAK